MFLGIIGAVLGATSVPLGAVAVPTAGVATSTSVIGVAQGTVGSQQQHQQGAQQQEPDKNDPRLAKFTLKVSCDSSSSATTRVDGRQIVLRQGKLYLDAIDRDERRYDDGHPFSGFYLEYPDGKNSPPMGLVSTIKPDPPELNWIYVDKNTLELKYGNKTNSIPHIYAPWDWTDNKQGLVLEGWEGFVALEEKPDEWVVCYDRDDDHLKRLRQGRRVLEISLKRSML